MSGRDSAVRAVGEVAGKYQYTLLQDAWHKDDANYNFAYSKDVADELARQGVKHFVIEADETAQEYIDDLISGRISRTEYIDIAKEALFHVDEAEAKRMATDMADMIIYSESKGISVHALDKVGGPTMDLYVAVKELHENTNADITTMKVKELSSALKKGMKGEGISDEQKEAAKVVLNSLGKLPRNDTVYEAIDKALIDERIAGDKDLAKRIEAATDGEKTAITFGVGHGMNKRDLDEYLGNSKVGKILLTPNYETHQAYFGEENVNVNPKEVPATLIYTDANPSDKLGKHEVQPWLAEAKAIGEEIKSSEFKDTKYSQLNLPSQAELDAAPRAVPVNEADISR